MTAYSQIMIVGITFLTIAILILFFKKLKKNQDEIKTLIAQRFSGQTIHLRERFALHIGQQSRGYSQVRGNGELILTDHELFFAMPFPKKIFSIPLNTITHLEQPIRCCGRCILKPLLKVNYTTETGEQDAVAFYVKELERWVGEIEQRR